MKSLSLILRILAIVAAIAATALFFISKGKLAEKETQLTQARQATAATQAELVSSNEKLIALEAGIKTERDALAESKRKLEGVRSEMYTARQEVSRSQQQLSQAKNKITELEGTARRLRADLVEAEQSLAATGKSGEINQLNDRIAELEKTNESLESELAKAKEAAANTSVVASKAVNTPGSAASRYTAGYASASAAAAPTFSIGAETTIQSISPENGLIVLNSTPALGLAPGQTITLVQDLKAVGKVQIQSVTDAYAVANILPGPSARSLGTGSKVQLLR
ncbi:MAG: hypothetical protein ACPG3X_07455 [Opitutales bacterium]